MSDKADVINNVRRCIKQCENLRETRFSTLFHKARTSKSDRRGNGYSSVVATYDIEEGEMKVHSVTKLQTGESLIDHNHDGAISLPVKPFMDTQTAKQLLSTKLQREKRTYLSGR